jgi:hypothetical protein
VPPPVVVVVVVVPVVGVVGVEEPHASASAAAPTALNAPMICRRLSCRCVPQPCAVCSSQFAVRGRSRFADCSSPFAVRSRSRFAVCRSPFAVRSRSRFAVCSSLFSCIQVVYGPRRRTARMSRSRQSSSHFRHRSAQTLLLRNRLDHEPGAATWIEWHIGARDRRRVPFAVRSLRFAAVRRLPFAVRIVTTHHAGSLQAEAISP